VILLLLALAFPLLVSAREVARRSSCKGKLSQWGVALQAYHDVHRSLPPAAVWSTTSTESLALHMSKQIDRFTHANWAQMLLPHIGEEQLATRFNPNRPVAEAENEAGRTKSFSRMNCPSDTFNRADNPYVFESGAGRSIKFARGNYAINAGTHCYKDGPGSTSSPYGDPAHLVIDRETREFRLWGNGVAGFNVSFSLNDFANGTSTLVALEEVRAGIHQLDLRGTWSLGQIAASATWGHGVNGDDYGPNNQRSRADDIIGCGQLHEILGEKTLARERMPCVSYVDANQNATARSQHPGGANVLFMDGAARLISDDIDPGLWHVMHSRETPAAVLAEAFEQRLSVVKFEGEAPVPVPPLGVAFSVSTNTESTGTAENNPVTNSLGMRFALIPAGEFIMGIPDVGNSAEGLEWPTHQLRITRPFLLGVHEVTRGQYKTILGAPPGAAATPSGNVDSQSSDADAELPVVDVTWDEAAEFCQRLSELPTERAADRWYRLPSEAEWEYACREGRSRPYRWSYHREPHDDSGETAGIVPALRMCPIGSFRPNNFGLYDMRGNAWEWTADWFDREYYKRSANDDPRGPSHGYLKVVRGGDWRFIGEPCHIDYPVMPPWKRSPFVGFRVVCEAQTIVRE
jgi:prepilin-type processing-associated H-X9-DG protein